MKLLFMVMEIKKEGLASFSSLENNDIFSFALLRTT